MVEIFKTNVDGIAVAEALIESLLRRFPGSKINFDLDDCDKVLRVEGENFIPQTVMTLVKSNGFYCEVLE